MEYTLTVGLDVSNLNITAVPENPKSKVNIYGNNGLKTGLNKVQIEVISEDGLQKRTYTINVTKTSDIKKANANLQTLAVEYFNLEPDFSSNTTSYRVNVPSAVEKINILAVPESMNAHVGVGLPDDPSTNGSILKTGDNVINIKVTAEDGITVKNYVLTVHRQTEAEDAQAAADEADNVKELEAAYEQANAERLSETGEIQNNKSAIVMILIGIFATTVVVVVMSIAYQMWRRRIKK